SLPGPAYLPELVGAAWAVGVAAWVRADVIVDAEAEARPLAAAWARGAAATGLGALVLLGVNAAADLRYLSARWTTLAPLSAGEAIGEFSTPLLDGGALRSDELGEGVHLLVFWTTWCGVCESEMPTLVELDRRYRGRGLRIAAINGDSDAPGRLDLVRGYRDSHALPFPVALDRGALRQRFRVRVFPHIVLIRDGQVRHMHQGRVLESTLAGEIEALLAEAGG
ncbi:MAG: TlpA disulfide reductase family protein, partial [Nannocystaceae bacterium]